MKIICFLLIISSFSFSGAKAQQAYQAIDVPKVLTERLKKFGLAEIPRQRTRWVRERVCEVEDSIRPPRNGSLPPAATSVSFRPDEYDTARLSCHYEDRAHRENYITSEYLSPVSIDPPFVTPLQYGQPVFQGLPSELLYTSQDVFNCFRSTPQSSTLNLTMSLTKSSSVTITRSVTTSIGGSLNLNVTTSFGSVGGQVSYQRQVGSQTGTTEGIQESIQRSGSANITLPPMSAGSATLTVRKIVGRIPFSTVAVYDGPLIANNSHKSRISDVLTESERTFPIEGYIQLSEASAGEVTFLEKRLDRRICGGSESVIVRPTSPLRRR